MVLNSERLSGVSLKGNGQVLACQTDESPSVIIMTVDTISQKVSINGEVSATTLKGKSIRSSEVTAATTVVVSLTTDVTVFTNTSAGTATLAAGSDGQVKYLAKTTAAGGGTNMVVTMALPGANTTATFSDAGDGATFVYNTSTAVWVLVGANSVVLA